MAVIVAVNSKNIDTLPIGPSKAKKPVCSSFQNKCKYVQASLHCFIR
jgi:hypothetical protein